MHHYLLILLLLPLTVKFCCYGNYYYWFRYRKRTGHSRLSIRVDDDEQIGLMSTDKDDDDEQISFSKSGSKLKYNYLGIIIYPSIYLFIY